MVSRNFQDGYYMGHAIRRTREQQAHNRHAEKQWEKKFRQEEDHRKIIQEQNAERNRILAEQNENQNRIIAQQVNEQRSRERKEHFWKFLQTDEGKGFPAKEEASLEFCNLLKKDQEIYRQAIREDVAELSESFSNYRDAYHNQSNKTFPSWHRFMTPAISIATLIVGWFSFSALTKGSGFFGHVGYALLILVIMGVIIAGSAGYVESDRSRIVTEDVYRFTRNLDPGRDEMTDLHQRWILLHRLLGMSVTDEKSPAEFQNAAYLGTVHAPAPSPGTVDTITFSDDDPDELVEDIEDALDLIRSGRDLDAHIPARTWPEPKKISEFPEGSRARKFIIDYKTRHQLN
jgi:hypothetical protein